MPYQEVCPMLRSKLRAMLSAKPNYQRLSYIESTGKQVIETVMKPSNNLTVYMDFQLTQTTYEGSNRFCCAYYADGHRYRPLKIYNNRFQIQKMSGASIASETAVDKNRHTILFNDVNGNVLWDGVNKGKVYLPISPPDDVGLGVFGQCQLKASSPNYGTDSLVKMRLYELIGYNKATGEEIYHAVPVLDNNGVACLYDKVSGRFEYDIIGQEAFNYAV